MVKEHPTLKEYINELENKIKALEKSSEDNDIKAPTKHELALQEFLANSIGRSKLASMIYGLSKNHGEGIGFSEAPCKMMLTLEKSMNPSCSGQWLLMF